jgi:hypothetical protein
MAKKVPPGGDTINGKYVPGGTRIGYGGFSILRNKKIWGEDADVFRPERWLEGEKIKELELTWEVVFNAGRYQCLGKNVALMELNKVFVEVSLSLGDSCPTNNCLLILSDPSCSGILNSAWSILQIHGSVFVWVSFHSRKCGCVLQEEKNGSNSSIYYLKQASEEPEGLIRYEDVKCDAVTNLR